MSLFTPTPHNKELTEESSPENGNPWGRLFAGLADTFQTTIVIDAYFAMNPHQNTRAFSRGLFYHFSKEALRA
ncbi:hypothetical protein IQ255_12890 [Pleurocapsales cyanobacterium LEGE 10410]|nr:hypothetical protein [Pleurocapsales cyanobacterium LEGE 10410]